MYDQSQRRIYGAREAYLVVSDAILLVCRAQGDSWYNCTGLRAGLRTNMYSTSPKAVKIGSLQFLEAVLVMMTVRGVMIVHHGRHVAAGT